MNNNEKRRHKRVRLPYVLKFRSLASNAPKNWDAVNPVNMSESGICFLTMEQFIPNTEMFLLVTNPALAEERIYDCKVLRSEKFQNHSPLYETAVTIENMDDDAKKAYQEILKAFMNGTKGE